MPIFLPIFPFFKPKIIPSIIAYEGVTSCASRASPLDETMKKLEIWIFVIPISVIFIVLVVGCFHAVLQERAEKKKIAAAAAAAADEVKRPNLPSEQEVRLKDVISRLKEALSSFRTENLGS